MESIEQVSGSAIASQEQDEAADTMMELPLLTCEFAPDVPAAPLIDLSTLDMTLLGFRLRVAMAKAGITQAQLARACGVRPPSVSGWLNGKTKYLKGQNLLAAAKALNVSQDWLATGDGTMSLYEETPAVIPNLPSNEFVQVSILNTRQSVLDDRFEEHLYEEKMAFRKSDLMALDVLPQDARVLTVADSSMEPTLPVESTVLINTADTALKDTMVYAIFHDGQMFFRRLVLEFSDIPGKRVWMMRCDHTDRQRYPDRRLPPDASVLGRAVWRASRL